MAFLLPLVGHIPPCYDHWPHFSPIIQPQRIAKTMSYSFLPNYRRHFGDCNCVFNGKKNSSQQMKINCHFSLFCTKWPHDCIKFKLLWTIKMQIFCRNVPPPWSVLNFLKMKAAGSSEMFATIPQTAVSWSVKRVPNLRVWLLSSPSATNVTEI